MTLNNACISIILAISEKISPGFISMKCTQLLSTMIQPCIECMLALIEHQIFGVEVLGDGTDKELGFWLRDRGLACKCHLRI
jgi:hypothetical protein